MDLEALIAPVVEAAGLELVDVSLKGEGGRRLLRVTVDRDGGVDLDTIAATSERISRRLDVEDAVPGSYTLEVTSPGVERPLRRPADFVRRVGEKVKVKTAEPVEGVRVLVGTIVAADEERVTISTEAGERTVAHDLIESARTVFEWGSRPRSRR
jgi:ribosome maturation factor RimP